MVISLSSQHLRECFKHQLDDLVHLLQQADNLDDVYLEMHKISEQLEKTIQHKAKLLETDFHNQELMGDYLRSVTESFDDLERLLRSSKTFIDVMHGKTKD